MKGGGVVGARSRRRAGEARSSGFKELAWTFLALGSLGFFFFAFFIFWIFSLFP